MTDSKLTPPPGNEPMSLRECRLIIERLLVVAGASSGTLRATRDALVDAATLGHDILPLLDREPDLLADADSAPELSRSADGSLDLLGSGQFALLLAPTIKDLVIVEIARQGHCTLHVRRVDRPSYLSALAPLLQDSGVELELTYSAPDSATLTATPLEHKPADSRHQAAVAAATQHGLPVEGRVWLDLYLRSNAALVPESPITRQHAGHQDVDEEGNFIRQMDDDADVELALSRRRGGRRAG